MRALVLSLTIASLVSMARLAHADAVPAPPTDCPRGSAGETSHVGQWCEPAPCASNADCKTFGRYSVPGKCEQTSLCVKTRSFPYHHRLATDAEPSHFDRTVAIGACGGGGSCAADARCETAMRCVADSAFVEPTSPAPQRGCGCGKTTANTKSSLLIGFFVGAWLLRRTRVRAS